MPCRVLCGLEIALCMVEGNFLYSPFCGFLADLNLLPAQTGELTFRHGLSYFPPNFKEAYKYSRPQTLSNAPELNLLKIVRVICAGEQGSSHFETKHSFSFYATVESGRPLLKEP